MSKVRLRYNWREGGWVWAGRDGCRDAFDAFNKAFGKCYVLGCYELQPGHWSGAMRAIAFPDASLAQFTQQAWPAQRRGE